VIQLLTNVKSSAINLEFEAVCKPCCIFHRTTCTNTPRIPKLIIVNETDAPIGIEMSANYSLEFHAPRNLPVLIDVDDIGRSLTSYPGHLNDH
jgi:hypothetical protein